MRQHTPDGYRCPFCRLAAGEDLSGEFSKQVNSSEKFAGRSFGQCP
jgi:hypothetical protein